MKRAPDDKMTQRRLTALRCMRSGAIRLGEVDVGVRRALIKCGRAILKHELGRGWQIEITESGLAALTEWEAMVAEKERTWRSAKA